MPSFPPGSTRSHKGPSPAPAKAPAPAAAPACKPASSGSPRKKTYSCPVESCGQSFSRNTSRRLHFFRIHDSNKPGRCSLRHCGLLCPDQTALAAHMASHNSERPWLCPFEGCDQRFRTLNTRRVHLVSHTGKKPCVCPWPDCGKAFRNPSLLEYHKRSHTGERPWPCRQPGCGKWFRQSAHLQRHRLTHKPDKPWACLFEGCDKRFSCLQFQINHSAIHTERPQVTCPTPGCRRRFRTRGACQLHSRYCGPAACPPPPMPDLRPRASCARTDKPYPWAARRPSCRLRPAAAARTPPDTPPLSPAINPLQWWLQHACVSATPVLPALDIDYGHDGQGLPLPWAGEDSRLSSRETSPATDERQTCWQSLLAPADNTLRPPASACRQGRAIDRIG